MVNVNIFISRILLDFNYLIQKYYFCKQGKINQLEELIQYHYKQIDIFYSKEITLKCIDKI